MSVHIRSKNEDRRYLEEACRDVQSVYVTCWSLMWGRNIHRIYSGNIFLILFLPSELHIRSPEGLDLETYFITFFKYFSDSQVIDLLKFYSIQAY